MRRHSVYVLPRVLDEIDRLPGCICSRMRRAIEYMSEDQVAKEIIEATLIRIAGVLRPVLKQASLPGLLTSTLTQMIGLLMAGWSMPQTRSMMVWRPV